MVNDHCELVLQLKEIPKNPQDGDRCGVVYEKKPLFSWLVAYSEFGILVPFYSYLKFETCLPLASDNLTRSSRIIKQYGN